MTLKRLSLTLFLVICVLYIAQGIYYYPQLPGTVATHFTLSGQPDAWSTKSSFIMLYCLIVGMVALLFLGTSYGMSKIPVSLINMPNKDHWLSEGHKQDTFDFMCHYSLWFASATLLFLLDMSHQTFRVHIGKAHSLTHPMLSLVIYMGFAIIWGIGFFIRFRRKDNPR